MERNVGQLRDIAIGRLLYNDNIQGVKKNEKRSNNKIGVPFSSLKTANEFLKSNVAAKNNFKAYIPSYLISCKGILRNIDPELDLETIFNNLRPSDDR